MFTGLRGPDVDTKTEPGYRCLILGEGSIFIQAISKYKQILGQQFWVVGVALGRLIICVVLSAIILACSFLEHTSNAHLVRINSKSAIYEPKTLKGGPSHFRGL